MKVKRRTRIGLALITVLLVVAGGWLYYQLYVSTDWAIQRAENFLFRRMQAARLNEPDSFRFFFVTNRPLVEGEGDLETRFQSARDETLQFGLFDTTIEPSLGLGKLLNSTGWFQNEEIELQQVALLDQGTFVEELRPLVEGSPYRSLLVVVHGFREAFPSALRKTAFLGHVLDIDSPILVFDWPGNQGSSLSGYRRARQVAAASGQELAETLEVVIREVQPDRLWLLANSMGGQVVADAFSALYAEADLADTETEIEHVVLTAPDVDRKEFDARFKQEIEALASHITVYVSSNDRALVMSRIVNRSQRQGESTLNPSQLEEALAVAAMIEDGEELITLVDVTPVNRTRNFHNFSLETPEFFDDLYLRLLNPSAPQSRLVYRTRTENGAVYSVLTRGR